MDSREIITGVEPDQADVLGSSPALCWICGRNPATTREHWLKRTDADRYLRPMSQQDPLHLHMNWTPRAKVGGSKSKHLKFAPSICEDCNSWRTQPHDAAWDQLHGYLRANWPSILRTGRFDLANAFPDDPAVGGLHVHLYFAKLFGCLAYELKVPIDLSGFARSIYFGVPHPDMALAVCNDDQARRPMALRSELAVWGQPDGRIEGTVWVYMVSPVAVKIFWRAPQAADLRPIAATWHPLDGQMRIKINQGI